MFSLTKRLIIGATLGLLALAATPIGTSFRSTSAGTVHLDCSLSSALRGAS